MIAPHLWLRLHRAVLVHAALFFVGCTAVWLLPLDIPDKTLIYLGWFALLNGHALARYFHRRAAFLFHLLTYAAGNGFIWRLPLEMGEKLIAAALWTGVIALLGLALWRRHT